MIRIYHIDCGADLSTESWKTAMALLDESHQEKLRQYKRPQDFKTGLFGRLLLLAGLSDLGLSLSILPPFSFNDFDKPDPLQRVHFNISHSHQHVVCALTTNHSLGIDIEYMNPELEWDDFIHTFRPLEWEEIKGNHQKFYTLWTQKEAVLKVAGTGFSIHPKHVLINKDIACLSGNEYKLLQLDINSLYQTHLAIPIDMANNIPIIKEWSSDIISYLS